MASGWMMIRLGVSALAAGAAAGMMLILALVLGGLFAGAPPGWLAFAMLIEGLWVAILGAILVSALPAFFAGASMWALGARFGAARRPPAWAAAGTAVGLGLWTLFELLIGSLGHGVRLSTVEVELLAASAGCGAGGALAFLGSMRLSRRWSDEAEHGPW